MDDRRRDIPGWFGPQGGELFGWLCLPESGRANLGVLLCQPIGEEEHNAHQTFRELAWALAGRGIASLRFDYHGTGDSTGDWNDPGRVAAWRASAVLAAHTLRSTGIKRLIAIGMRLGATVVATAAAGGGLDDPDRPETLTGLVLWDPCSGRSMLREGKARCPEAPPPPSGAVDTPGYRYSPETVDDLYRLDPAGVDRSRLPHRVLVLARDDRPAPRGLRTAMGDHTVEWATAHGQATLLDIDMTKSIVPRQTMGEVIGWVSALAAERGQFDAPTVPELHNPLRDSLQIGGEVGAITESVASLGSSALFGIVSEPTVDTRGVTLVMVNVANDRHVGPGRRWIGLSRILSARGFRVVRLDQGGTGDSPMPTDRSFGQMYPAGWLSELPAALDAPILSSRPVAMIGLCSGAYSALESAFARPVRAVYAVNVILHATPVAADRPAAGVHRVAARTPNRPTQLLAEHRPRTAMALWRIYRQFAVLQAPMAAIHQLIQRGTDVVLLLTRDDGRHFREVAFWFPKRRQLTATLRFRHVESGVIDHALMTQIGQEFVTHVILRDLDERFPAGTGPDGRHS